MTQSIDTKLQSSLQALLSLVNRTSQIDAFWSAFYTFVILSYRTPEERRISVGELSHHLQLAGAKRPGQLATTYAHCMYCLAVNDGRAIHFKGFNP